VQHSGADLDLAEDDHLVNRGDRGLPGLHGVDRDPRVFRPPADVGSRKLEAGHRSIELLTSTRHPRVALRDITSMIFGIFGKPASSCDEFSPRYRNIKLKCRMIK
jgi:hypothetical protein